MCSSSADRDDKPGYGPLSKPSRNVFFTGKPADMEGQSNAPPAASDAAEGCQQAGPGSGGGHMGPFRYTELILRIAGHFQGT